MPEGWQKVTLGEICDLAKGQTATQKASPGEYPLVVTAEARSSSDTYQFDAPAVCVPMVSSTGHGHASLKRVHYQDGKFAVASIITACTAKNGAPIQMKYLWLYLDHLRNDLIVPRMKGTANVSLSQRALGEVPITLPPLREQERIVDLIATLDTTIEKAERVANRAEAAIGIAVQALASRATEGAKTPLGDHGMFVRGKRFTKADYTDDGVACVHYGQIYTSLGPVTTEPLTRLPEDMATKLRLVAPGEVIVAATSENVEDVGKATLWAGEGPAAFHDDSYAYRHDLNPMFATFLFVTPDFHHAKRKFVAGLKVMRISGDSLSRIELPIPDREEQDKIADVASELTATADGANASLTRLRALRANLLTVLLSGEHEIPQSYDDLMGDAS